MKTWAWVTAAVLAGGTMAHADGAGNTNPVAARVRQLERDIPSLYLLNALTFSSGEAAALMQPLEESRKIEQEADKRTQEAINRRAASLDDFFVSRPADKRPGGLPRTIRHEMDAIRREARQKATPQAERVLNFLSESRAAVLANFLPCFIPPGGSNVTQRADEDVADMSLPEAVLGRLRTAAARNERMATQQALDLLVPFVMNQRHMVHNEESEQQVRGELAKKLKDTIGMLTAFSEADFEQEKSGMAADVVAVKRSLDLSDLKARVRQYLLNPGIYDVVKQRAGVKDGKSADHTPAVTGELRADEMGRAAGANLTLRAVGLTRAQAERLLSLVEEVVLARQKAWADLLKATQEAAGPYETLRKELATGAATPASEAAARERYSAIQKLRESTDLDALLAGERKLDTELAALQVAVLSGETQRLVKSGLAGKDEGIEASLQAAAKVLTDLRWMKPADYEAKKQGLAAQFVAESIKLANLDDGAIEADASTKRAMAVMDDARKLKDQEFTAKRADLAMDLLPRLRQGRPPAYAAKYLKGAPVRTACATTRALFSDEGLAALRKMLGRK